MKCGLNEAIARELILAQAASDGGKNIKDLLDLTHTVPGLKSAYKEGYSDKDKHIRKALKLIQRSHGKSGFSYYVTKDPEILYRWEPMNLIYFNFKVDGIRFQMSFHSPYEFLDDEKDNKSNKKHMTHWDRKDSRYAARVLAEKVLC